MVASDEITACPATQDFDLKILRDCAYQRLDDLMKRSIAAHHGNASISGSQGLYGQNRRMPCVFGEVQLCVASQKAPRKPGGFSTPRHRICDHIGGRSSRTKLFARVQLRIRIERVRNDMPYSRFCSYRKNARPPLLRLALRLLGSFFVAPPSAE